MSKTSDKREAARAPIPAGYYRVNEAAALSSTSKDTIYQWARKKRVRSYRDGRLLYVKMADVERARQRNRVSTKIPTRPPDGMITVRRASAATGVKVRTIQDWANTGRIKAIKHGPRLWYVDPDDVQELAKTMQPGYPTKQR